MLRTIRRDIHFYLWWLLVLPGLAVAQSSSQCTLYRETGYIEFNLNQPGPWEPSLFSAEADAEAILEEIPPLQAPGATIYGYVFVGCVGNAISTSAGCGASWGETATSNGVLNNVSPPINGAEVDRPSSGVQHTE